MDDERGPWFIVLYEWQGAQDLSDCTTWWPSADILSSWEGAGEVIELMRKGETPRPGKLTYRNIRGPFSWLEPAL